MLQSVSSLDGSYSSKKTYDLPDLLAKQWVAAGYAKFAQEPTPAPVEAPAPAPTAEITPTPAPAPAPVEAPAPAPAAEITSRRTRKTAAPKPDLL